MSKTTRKLLGDYLVEIRPASKKNGRLKSPTFLKWKSLRTPKTNMTGGTSTMNESTYFLLKMGDFSACHVSELRGVEPTLIYHLYTTYILPSWLIICYLPPIKGNQKQPLKPRFFIFFLVHPFTSVDRSSSSSLHSSLLKTTRHW